MRAKSSVETGGSPNVSASHSNAKLPQSKSETNLIDTNMESFVLITEGDIKAEKLGEGGRTIGGSARSSPRSTPKKERSLDQRNSLMPGQY